MTCAHRDDAGAYVLGALSPDEHERFAAHVGGCEACRAEVDSLQIVVDTLPLAAEQVGPPPELKERIMAVVQAEAAVLRAAGPEADVADAAAPAPVEERARPRRTGSGRKATRPRWRVPLRPLPLAAAASVLVALIVAGAVLLSGGGDQGRTVQARVVAPSAPGAHAALVVGSGRATLRVEDFPAPPRGRVYQVWLKRPGRPPDPTTALFTVRGGGATVDVPGGVRDGEQVLVTAEPDGGSSAPTSPPVIVAEPA